MVLGTRCHSWGALAVCQASCVSGLGCSWHRRVEATTYRSSPRATVWCLVCPAVVPLELFAETRHRFSHYRDFCILRKIATSGKLMLPGLKVGVRNPPFLCSQCCGYGDAGGQPPLLQLMGGAFAAAIAPSVVILRGFLWVCIYFNSVEKYLTCPPPDQDRLIAWVER